MTTKEKAELLHRLHHTDKILIFPNIWDSLGAKLLESLGYKAVATASAATALTNGIQDGEKLSFEFVLEDLQKIANSVSIPVTADIESGYAHSDSELAENMSRLMDAGIVGINIEDSDKITKTQYDIDFQCKRIEIIRETANKKDIPLFINARSDSYIYKRNLSDDEQLKDTIARGKAYKSAGADGFYPILINKVEQIKAVVSEVELPVNVLTFRDIPEINELEKMGVKRLSLGPSLLKIAIKSMKELAENLKENKGLSSILGNPVTSDYLENLVG